VVIGALLLRPALGLRTAPLVGLFTATFTGGSLNFVSVSRAMALPDGLVAVAAAADQLVFTLWFALSLWFGAPRQGEIPGAIDDYGTQPAPRSQPSPSEPGQGWRQRWWRLPLLLLLAWALVAGSGWISAEISRRWVEIPGLPILTLTTLTLLVAQLPWRSRQGLAYATGLVLIHPFFAVVGMGTSLAAIRSGGEPVLAYAGMIVSIQALLLWVLQRRLGWGRVDTLVASQAAIGGPSTALALATACGRRDLALPGVAIGLLGYVIGTYLGLALAALMV
jgi:uncharacterized membrane protein